MKKIFKLITPLAAMLILLTACSGEKTKVFVDKDGYALEVTVHYKGDIVNKVVTVAKPTGQGDDLNSTRENLQKSIDEKDKKISGYTQKAEIKDNSVIIVTELNYDTLDFEKYKSAMHLSKSDTLENERKLTTVEKNLTESGFKEK